MIDIHPLRFDAECFEAVALRGEVLAGGRDAGVADLQSRQPDKCAV